MAEIQAWITINGKRIPILKGENKQDAVNKFIKNKTGKRNLKRMKTPDELTKEADKHTNEYLSKTHLGNRIGANESKNKLYNTLDKLEKSSKYYDKDYTKNKNIVNTELDKKFKKKYAKRMENKKMNDLLKYKK